MNRWGLFTTSNILYPAWRSPRQVSLSPNSDSKGVEMKKRIARKKLVAASPPSPAHGMVVGGQMMSVAEVRDYQRRVREDPRSVR